MQRGITSFGRKRKEMKKASHKNRAVELKVRPIRAVKCLFSQSFLEIIFITVFRTSIFWQFLLIPRPYTHNFSCGETLAHNWCPQFVLLHYFAIKVMFKAFYSKHFPIILYGKSQTVLIISRGSVFNYTASFPKDCRFINQFNKTPKYKTMFRNRMIMIECWMK